MTGRPAVKRDRTAIVRYSLSRPLRFAMEAGLVGPDREVFDYGCGRGSDLKHLARLGIRAAGWDPVHRPEEAQRAADVVNLGYVLNVIENPAERADALRRAWELARRVLVVAARLSIDAPEDSGTPFEDGCLTSRQTFQKFFGQTELRECIDDALGVSSIAAAPGVFFVFRDEALRQGYFASRYLRPRAAPKPRKSDLLFEQHKALLEPLIAFVSRRGRLPDDVELPEAPAIVATLGSTRQAFAVVRRVTGSEQWERIRDERHQELLIHLALSRFGGRPRFSELPLDLRLDIRDFFSTYKSACESADRLLFSSGDMGGIDAAVRSSAVGKLTGNALYVHVDALHLLSPVLRVYEGCARNYVGVVERANLIKLHRDEPRISYLYYPGFDRHPHPALHGSFVVGLQTLDAKYRDYSQSENPPILHRKEEFLGPDDPRRQRFAHLTAQEERRGLLADASAIGFRSGWDQVLAARGVRLRGHRLVRSDPSGTAAEPGAIGS